MLPSSRCKSEAARFLRLAPWLGVTYSDLRAFLSIAAPWRGGRVAKAWTQIQGLQPLQPWRVPELERATLLLNDPAACAARPERSWPPPCPWSSSHRGRPALGARRPRPPPRPPPPPAPPPPPRRWEEAARAASSALQGPDEVCWPGTKRAAGHAKLWWSEPGLPSLWSAELGERDEAWAGKLGDSTGYTGASEVKGRWRGRRAPGSVP